MRGQLVPPYADIGVHIGQTGKSTSVTKLQHNMY